MNLSNNTHPERTVTMDNRTVVDRAARVRLTYGCSTQLTDGDIYDCAHNEGFCQDKSGEYWPDGEFDAPSISYHQDVEVKAFDAKLGVWSGVCNFRRPYGQGSVQLNVELYSDEYGPIWWVVG